MFGLIVGTIGYAIASSAVFESPGVGFMAGLAATMVWGFLYARWFSKR